MRRWRFGKGGDRLAAGRAFDKLDIETTLARADRRRLGNEAAAEQHRGVHGNREHETQEANPGLGVVHVRGRDRRVTQSMTRLRVDGLFLPRLDCDLDDTDLARLVEHRHHFAEDSVLVTTNEDLRFGIGGAQRFQIRLELV
jgi:hypothetical protein